MIPIINEHYRLARSRKRSGLAESFDRVVWSKTVFQIQPKLSLEFIEYVEKRADSSADGPYKLTGTSLPVRMKDIAIGVYMNSRPLADMNEIVRWCDEFVKHEVWRQYLTSKRQVRYHGKKGHQKVRVDMNVKTHTLLKELADARGWDLSGAVDYLLAAASETRFTKSAAVA